jgi:hypothetical protein
MAATLHKRSAQACKVKEPARRNSWAALLGQASIPRAFIPILPGPQFSSHLGHWPLRNRLKLALHVICNSLVSWLYQYNTQQYQQVVRPHRSTWIPIASLSGVLSCTNIFDRTKTTSKMVTALYWKSGPPTPLDLLQDLKYELRRPFGTELWTIESPSCGGWTINYEL